jgi:crotonobetainyl-CoA:carnitine CoA-transferase CaiB-like acyl-CoA transferase
MTDETLPFEGLRVLDVASWIAAPVAATILGDLGADVIKIEPPGEGDPYRALPDNPAFPQVGVNYTWIMDGRAKRSLTLNLKSEEGNRILHRLVEGCDVFITNLPFAVRGRLKLSYDDLAPLNPRMIYASLTAYGERGPERDESAFDQVAYWARSGLCELMRLPDEHPVQGLPGMGDHPTGVSLYAAISTALYRRERTGKGGLVHTSLHANGFWSNGCLGQAALAGGSFDDRRNPDPQRPLLATHVLYRARDGRYLQFNMVRLPEQVEAAFEVLGIAALLEDSRFATPEDREANGVVLSGLLQEAISVRPAAEWLDELRARGVPVCRVAQVEEMRGDEQAKANDVLVEAKDPEIGMSHIINHPVRLDGVRGRGPTRPPEVGEHCDEILAELGYSATEIAALRKSGAI